MNVPPIIIEIKSGTAYYLYNIDFENFKEQMEKLPGVQIVHSLCFDEHMIIGINVTCEKLHYFSIVKRFKNYFQNRWKIPTENTIVTFDNDAHFLDYKKKL